VRHQKYEIVKIWQNQVIVGVHEDTKEGIEIEK